MIKIFNANDRDFSSAGNIIIEPIKCTEYKKKSLNGWYIEVEIPIKYKEYINKDKLCVIKTKSKLNPQAFRIGEKIQCTSKKIKFNAEHVMFDAKDYLLLDVRPTNQNGLNCLNYINERTDNVSPFSIYSNVENIDTAYFIRKNLLEAWTIIEERWGGVFDADNWNISFLTSVGNDNGETIVYRKNMQGFEIYEDWSTVCTKLCAVGYDGLMLPETYLESDVQYEKPYTRVIDFQTALDSEEQSEENLLSELRENAEAYLEENKVPKVSYTVISNINEKLEIGDTIKVLHPFVQIFTEVLEYEYDSMSKKVKSLTFGNYSRDVKTKFENIKNSITKINQFLSKQEVVINTQTNLINTLNKNGIVYIDDNEILILDTLPKENAKNVWRFGLGGIGFSSNGYEGSFETAMTMDGQINANFITTGTLNVSRIEGLSEQISIVVSNDLQVTNDEIKKIKEQTDELKVSLDGLTNTLSEKGGNNLIYYDKEFWNVEKENEDEIEEYTDTEFQNNSISGYGYRLNNGHFEQTVQVVNGIYTVSFNYKKIKELATGTVIINGFVYELSKLDWTKFSENIEVNSNYITIEFDCDTLEAFYVTDLLINLGDTAEVWTQNPNETRTDTVKIGKGIQITSTAKDTKLKADADGVRVVQASNENNVVTEFTDKGTKTEYVEADGGEMAGVLFQKVNYNGSNQTWISSLL